MSHRGCLIRRLLAAAGAAVGLAAAAPPANPVAKPVLPHPTRPNIVVILVDDMGFSDLGSYGSEIPTPNLDALAAGGLRFTQFYNAARCSPSRAALLTGAYPHQAGMGHLEAIRQPQTQGLHGRIEDHVVTLAEVLRPAGYLTAMAGKWHLGMTHGVNPWARGFDRNLTSPIGELYFPDQPQEAAKTVFIGDREVPAGAPEVGRGRWYSSDLFAGWGARFADEARSAGKPFFLYLPLVAPHFPIMAPVADVALFKGRYAAGWNAIRRERFARQKRLGIVPADAALPAPLANTYDWDRLTQADRERFDTIMAVYAAAIHGMDRAVGTLVEHLRATGQLDNTLILFMSDNGGNAESGPDGRLLGEDPGSARSRVFAGMNWATAQNTPFSYFKHYTEEGGIATPLIAHWPRGIAPRLRGSTVSAPGHLVDVMPTLVELAGATYPRSVGGKAIVPMQGRSMVPAFSGRPLTRATPIFWEHEGNRAVRAGQWKLVARYRQPWQLFDIDADRTELHDLAARHPDRVRALAARWDRWAEASAVDPWLDAYDPYLGGKPRQNWGGGEMPERPYAIRH